MSRLDALIEVLHDWATDEDLDFSDLGSRLAALRSQPEPDPRDAEEDEAVATEQARTQAKVVEALESVLGADTIVPGDGCDSADPLDWTCATVSMTVRRATEGRDAEIARLREAVEKLGKLLDRCEAWMVWTSADTTTLPPEELLVALRAALRTRGAP